MTGYGKAVLWIGLILIVLNLARYWGDIRQILFGSDSSTTAQGGLPIIPPFGPFNGAFDLPEVLGNAPTAVVIG